VTRRIAATRTRSTHAAPAETVHKALRLRPETPLGAIAGIGPKRAAALAERGIVTVADALFHLPARYQDWRTRTPIAQLQPGVIATVEGRLVSVTERAMHRWSWRRLVSARLDVGAGRLLRLVWFNFPRYMSGRLPEGDLVLVKGRVVEAPDSGLEIAHPEIVALAGGATPAIRPVYRLPASVGQRLFASVVARGLVDAAATMAPALPEDLRGASGCEGLAAALDHLHRPPESADIDALNAGTSAAHAALAMDELFAFELALARERVRAGRRSGVALRGATLLSERLIAEAPFEPTGAQRRAIQEIRADLESPVQMNRMLLGDVGSGKTFVAFWAILRAVESGTQAIVMTPTEILAEQHFRNFKAACGRFDLATALLTGRLGAAERQAVLRGIQAGAIKVVFGTQALIQQGVRVARLGLGVIDEQHRFGVFDRAKLKDLGPEANLLTMTATPIPRSLAMSMFANLDVSMLDELPRGRRPVATELLTDNELPEVDAMVREQAEAGHRVYYVMPRIEGDADEDVRSVKAAAERLAGGRLGSARIGALHGRLPAVEKERVMRRFRDGAIDVLVATTVIEVGIDVPEATLIVVCGAERYGLAQLHQLRGRVGRGDRESKCVLVASADADRAALERLHVMVDCRTGAEVAEADLRIRGPGDLLGARQSGALPLRFADYIRDLGMIERARRLVEEWLMRDPELDTAASNGARAALRRMLTCGFSLGDVG
jgi:ATP-dependent DNA helicase RecG